MTAISGEITRQTKQGRGVLYIAWNDRGYESARGMSVQKILDRSIDSVKALHPELPIHVKWLPDGASLLDKAQMYELSPFRETLYLDVDTVVLERLDFGFAMASRYGLACSICECPWARRFKALEGDGDLIEYNTGVLFFSHIAKRHFDSWRCQRSLDSSLKWRTASGVATMPANDQAGFAKACQVYGHPFVLPLNWNFRPDWHRGWFGPVKVWHDYRDVPQTLRNWNAGQLTSDTIDFASAT